MARTHPSTAPRDPASDTGDLWLPDVSSGHTVQYYSNDNVFLCGLTRWIGTQLGSGDTCVVIATAAHRSAIAIRLTERGISLPIVRGRGAYVVLDARLTLRRIMIGGQPSARIMWEFADELFGSLQPGGGRVHLFGEMVALLWARGNYRAALALEDLWNDIGGRYQFDLFCAYPDEVLEAGPKPEWLAISDRHQEVLAAPQ